MFGKIIDMNNTDAFIECAEGLTINVSINKLPTHTKIGDKINLSLSNSSTMLNNKIIDFI
ncbi:MAG: hypothetical protein KID00_14095 [Clostridium argentinense]|uniref:Uncharacterized protein n=1 Tax=Clostridium faecium TaxID=2762223 RepID=A0ABR8YW13_9CLOT|nr:MULTISPECIES: hypothetical protein [Clostridium]MBD8048188.1 hypothetical protein [Clostridium faecium]MBS5824956.1 hypothetical protein [Clostridium argentinense]MDU1348634.1 hypothetical protein [Clostridium argentinense]